MMALDMNSLLVSFLFGSIGVAYFIYGKKQKRKIPFFAGLSLCVFPYFISSLPAMITVGAILTVTPFLLKE